MAKPAMKPATKPTAKPETKAVAFVQPSALSPEVGKFAMVAFRDTKSADEKISAAMEVNAKKKYETLKSLTLAYVKAAKADKTIKLAEIHSDKAAAVDTLYNKLRVATGIMTATVGEDGAEKLALAPWTKEFLNHPGDDKKTEEGIKKETFRGNFTAVMKKAILAADAVVSKDLKMRENEDGILMITGKAIKERFNVDEIALNEKREVETGQKDAQGVPVKTKLAKIPSYTELGRISAENVGKTITTRVDSRAKLGGAALSEKDIIAAIDVLQGAIAKMKNFSDVLATKLEGLQNTIEQAINENQGTEEQ